jgi:protein MPE1
MYLRHLPGHYINVCPTLGDEKFDNKPKIKRTTGIPKIFLKSVDGVLSTDGTVMVTHTGELVVAKPNEYV